MGVGRGLHRRPVRGHLVERDEAVARIVGVVGLGPVREDAVEQATGVVVVVGDLEEGRVALRHQPSPYRQIGCQFAEIKRDPPIIRDQVEDLTAGIPSIDRIIPTRNQITGSPNDFSVSNRRR